MDADHKAIKHMAEKSKGPEDKPIATQPTGLLIPRVPRLNWSCKFEEKCYEKLCQVGRGAFRY